MQGHLINVDKDFMGDFKVLPFIGSVMSNGD